MSFITVSEPCYWDCTGCLHASFLHQKSHPVFNVWKMTDPVFFFLSFNVYLSTVTVIACIVSVESLFTEVFRAPCVIRHSGSPFCVRAVPFLASLSESDTFSSMMLTTISTSLESQSSDHTYTLPNQRRLARKGCSHLCLHGF